MAISLTTGSTVGGDVIVAEYLEKRFVSRLERELLAIPLGVKSTLPTGNSNVVQWTYFNELPSSGTAVTSAATEGATPSVSTLTSNTATATLAEFGQYIDFTKVFDLHAMAGTREQIVDVFAHQGAVALDTVTMTAIDATTTSVDAGTAMTAEAVRTAVATLETNNADPHRATPGGQFYCGIFSPEACYDMMGEGAPVWFQVKSADYVASLTTPFRETIPTAAVYNCIVKRSTNVQQAASVDQNVIVADESFGVSSLATNVMRPRIIITEPETNSSSPLRTTGTLGWWAYFAVALFDNNRVVLVTSNVT